MQVKSIPDRGTSLSAGKKMERGLCTPRIGNQFFRNEEAGKTMCEESSKL